MEDNSYLYITSDNPSGAGFTARATGMEAEEEEIPAVFELLA